jgi:PKD repeat protein
MRIREISFILIMCLVFSSFAYPAESAAAIAILRMKKNSKPAQAITLEQPDITNIQATLSANKTTANIGDYVTFTARASGGTPPYTYYWWFDGDTAWTQQPSNIYSRQITRPVKQTMYLVVKDYKNKVTDEYPLSIKVIGSNPKTPESTPEKQQPK